MPQAQREACPLIGIEQREELVDIDFCRRVGVVILRFHGDSGKPRPLRAMPPLVVEKGPPGDSKKPCGVAARSCETAGMAPSPQESLLCEIVCRLPPGKTRKKASNPCFMEPHERSERAPVPLCSQSGKRIFII